MLLALSLIACILRKGRWQEDDGPRKNTKRCVKGQWRPVKTVDSGEACSWFLMHLLVCQSEDLRGGAQSDAPPPPRSLPRSRPLLLRREGTPCRKVKSAQEWYELARKKLAILLIPIGRWFGNKYAPSRSRRPGPPRSAWYVRSALSSCFDGGGFFELAPSNLSKPPTCAPQHSQHRPRPWHRTVHRYIISLVDASQPE